MNAHELYDSYAHESYQNSFDHGFWEAGETRSKGEMVMLMVSKLGECQEAHRKDYWAILSFNEWKTILPQESRVIASDDELWNLWFEEQIKNTVQDEMADVAIRIMDFVYGWRCLFVPQDYRKDPTGNFSHDLLRLNWYIMLAFEDHGNLHPGKDWGYALSALTTFCGWWEIDLARHIEMKQRYNRTRPYKHSKKY